jgi:hypothetical protein
VFAVAGGLLLAAAGVVAYVLVSGGDGAHTPKQRTATSIPRQVYDGHRLLYPECTPLTGRRWFYPVSPPPAGLQPIEAKIESNLYEVFSINYDCKEASTWVQRLSRTKIAIKGSGDATVLKGPAGFFCSAWPDTAGHAYAGGCQTESGGDCRSGDDPAARACRQADGKRAFGWNWNVANRRVVFVRNEAGKLNLTRVGGADTNITFRTPSEGTYELQVMNTSGIGYLDEFSWSPPEGWKVTKLKGATGADCSLTDAGKILCSGKVRPPSCLCSGDGGSVTIRFAAEPTRKNPGYLVGGGASGTRITKMTPVPYLIPGTPKEAAKHRGV